MSNFASLTHMRIRLALRNKMFFFFSIVMPFIFFFGYLGFFGKSVPAGAAYFLGPVLALNVMGSFWGLSATIVMFREQGILRRFHVSPVTASDLLASSVVANIALTLPTVTLELLLARLIFHVHTLDNLFGILVLVAIGTMSFACLGLVIASVTNTMQETQVLNQLIWLPLIFLSMQLFRWEPETKIPRRAKLLVLATAIPFVLLGIWENRTDRILRESQTAFAAFESALDSLRPAVRMTIQPGNAVNPASKSPP